MKVKSSYLHSTTPYIIIHYTEGEGNVGKTHKLLKNKIF